MSPRRVDEHTGPPRPGRGAAVLLLALLLALTSASFSAATTATTATTATSAAPAAPATSASAGSNGASSGAAHARKKPPKKHKHKKHKHKKTKKKAAKPCAGQTPKKPDGTLWKCVFSDEFGGTKLDRKKWGVVRTAQNGYHIGPECYVDRPDTVSVSRGALHLTVRKVPAFSCQASPNGKRHYASDAVAGSLTTIDTFTRTYGRYQIRAAFPATKIGGLHSAIWMFPKKISSVGFGNDYGEIDIAEYFTKWSGRAIPVLHYRQPATVPQSEWTNSKCFIAHPERFHTYTLVWTSSSIAISYDGKMCLYNDTWRPRWPMKRPAPFDKPFALLLTQGLGVRGNAPTAATPLPATMHVDWVRVWR